MTAALRSFKVSSIVPGQRWGSPGAEDLVLRNQTARVSRKHVEWLPTITQLSPEQMSNPQPHMLPGNGVLAAPSSSRSLRELRALAGEHHASVEVRGVRQEDFFEQLVISSIVPHIEIMPLPFVCSPIR